MESRSRVRSLQRDSGEAEGPSSPDQVPLDGQPGHSCARCARVAEGLLLVVDDDLDTRELLRDILVPSGYRVALAGGAHEALAVLAAGRSPCAILLDLVMPGLDGWGFLALRQRLPAVARIPVGLISGSIDMRARRLGASACLAKPFVVEEVLALVRHCCSAWHDVAARR
jgi:CheY-like chemotaxis protein